MQTAITPDELHRRFTYHAPDDAKQARHAQLRSAALAYATILAELTPHSREQSLALTHLEEALMWGNAAIARNAPAY